MDLDAPPTPAQLVGERIRGARRLRDLSLTALAHAAGVGKGSLSEIEQGVRNPTLGTLYALATALGVPLSWLLAERVGATASSDALTSVLLDVDAADDVTTEVYALSLAPAAEHRSAAHGDGVREHLLVVRGAVRAGRAGEEVDLAEGESSTWVSDRGHTYRALGGGAARAVLVIRWPGRRLPPPGG